MTNLSAPRPQIKPIIVGLSLLGLLFSAVSLYQHVVVTHGLTTGPSFCNISQHINCDLVNASSWSVFLGLPIAAYGLFFYVVILGLMLCSGPGHSVSAHKAYEVVLFLAVLASMASLILFGISEFIIGALCLMCLGLYVTNFCLLAAAYWASTSGSILSGFLGGLQNIVEFALRAFSGSPRALLGLLAVILCALASATSPQFVLRLVSDLQGARGKDVKQQIDWVSQWRASPVANPRFATEGGSFGDYAKGDPAAPIQIVEFADMECPGCREMYSALSTMLKEFEGQYHLVFKNYPLDQGCNPGISQEFHLFACHAAYIARCAGEQGKFWESLDLMFTDQALTGDGKPEEVKATLLKNAVSSLGLDGDAMQECVDSARYKAKLVSDVEEGMRLGLTSTPSFWINGKLLPVPSREGLTQIFDAILTEKGLVRSSTQDKAKGNE
jgi:protein-disulfide isomerase/uncharacterized membrane protein